VTASGPSVQVRQTGLATLAVIVLAACWFFPVTVSWRFAPDLGHAWAVPLLMAYLWWERWGERPALVNRGIPKSGWWLLAIAVGAVELPLRLLLTPFPQWPMLLATYTLLFVTVALTAAWLVAGRAGVRWIGSPLILLFSVLPVPSLVENTLIIPLREIWAALSAEISNLLGLPAIAMGTSVRLGNGWVGVDEACGGIRSLQACVMIGLFFGEWYRFSLWRRVWLVAAGIGAALLGNFGRVLFLSLRASAGARAVESAHDLAGWIAMAASLALTGWLACRWAGYRFPEQRIAPRLEAPPTQARSSGFLWLAAVAALFVLNDAGTRLWFTYGERVRAAIPQWTAALPERHWSFHRTPLTEGARALLRPDIFTGGSWRTESNVSVSGYYVEWRRGQVARSVPFLHNPTVCLPLAGCELVSTLYPFTVRWSGGEIPFFAYKFHRVGEDILVAFTIWDPARGRLLTKPGEFRSWKEWWDTQWTEVREARQNQPAQLLTVTVPWQDGATQLAQNLLGQIIKSDPKP